MKHIRDALNGNNISESPEEAKVQSILDPLSVKLVEYVFAKFYLLCRGADALFSDVKRLHAEKTQWQSCFSREGYTSIEHIRKGLLRLERHKYPNPPQLGEFLSWNMASGEDYEFLSKEQAYKRAYQIMRDGDVTGLSVEQVLIIRHTIRESDSHFLKNNSMTKTQPVFYRNYEISVRDFILGKLKDIPKGIEDKTEETIEIAKQCEIKKDFAHLTSYQAAKAQIERILGVKIDGTHNKRRL